MELANIAFRVENYSKRSILAQRWRKCNMKEKLDNLHNENRGKRVILWKFLNDGQIHNYNPVQTGRDCESMSYESYSINGYESRATLNQAHLFDDDSSCNSLSSSDSSSLSGWLRPGLIREAGDGTETPDIPRCLSNRGARKRLQKRCTDKPCHTDRNENSTPELEYSCTLRLFAQPEEPSTRNVHRHGFNTPVIPQNTCIHSNHGHVSSTDVNNKDCQDVETSQHNRCNAFTLTKARQRHNTKNKLKQLLKLYKARKLNKKRRGKEHVRSTGNGNALNTDGSNRLGCGKLASISRPSQNVLHEDMCQSEGLDNRVGWCAPYRSTVHQNCEFTEKNDTANNRLADFYDCDGLDLAVDCYCSETDELAYLNNGFVMD